MQLVAGSFAWPFRGRWQPVWAIGVLVVLLLPLLFILALGYAIAATRAAEVDAAAGPPPWRMTSQLLVDGVLTSIALLITAVPFAMLLNPLAKLLHSASVPEPYAHVVALFTLALPWGLIVLLHFPHATAAFAASGRPWDLFDARASLLTVRRDTATWNVAAAAMVTAWAIGLACAGLLCVGIVPGIFYAILVSAHASAAVFHEDSHKSSLPHPNPRAG